MSICPPKDVYPRPAKKASTCICGWCSEGAVTKVPAGVIEWACPTHAELFWRGLLVAARELAVQDRAANEEWDRLAQQELHAIQVAGRTLAIQDWPDSCEGIPHSEES